MTQLKIMGELMNINIAFISACGKALTQVFWLSSDLFVMQTSVWSVYLPLFSMTLQDFNSVV